MTNPVQSGDLGALQAQAPSVPTEKADPAVLGLIQRLESEGPSRELDSRIYNALVDDGGRIAFRVENWATPPGNRLSRYHDGWLVGYSPTDQYADDLPRYTTSIDAVLKLAEKAVPETTFRIDLDGRARVWAYDKEDCFGTRSTIGSRVRDWEAYAESPEPALAICLAVLKATTANTVGTKAEGCSARKATGETQ